MTCDVLGSNQGLDLLGAIRISSRNRMRSQADLKPLAHGPENGRKVIHTGIAFGRKHPVQTIDCAVLAMSHDGHVAGAVLTVSRLF